MILYQDSDYKRVIDGPSDPSIAPTSSYRSPFWRDYARLIHCSAFRRLQGKTQLYPGHENDYFRNRLTHSMEVAQIAKTIALKVNHEFGLDIDTDLVQFAALAHDIGHPPFGHQGEEALDERMIDFGGFEGNAQTLRVITRLEKKFKPNNIFEDTTLNDLRVGLNLTSRGIASILKYDQVIPSENLGRQEYAEKRKIEVGPVKGYNDSESDIVDYVKENVLGTYNLKTVQDQRTGEPVLEKFKTIECQIMDISDDIAYSTYDLDDTLKANFCNPFDIVFTEETIVKRICKSLSKTFDREIRPNEVKNTFYGIFREIFYEPPPEDRTKINALNIDEYLRVAFDISYRAGKNISQDGYLRNGFTSKLINRFVTGITFFPHEYLPLSTVRLADNIKMEVEALKTFNYEINILSSRLKITAYRGQEIVKKIFDILTDDEIPGYMLLPQDFKEIYLQCKSERDKRRTVCDFIAGMTDKYCIEFYGRLTSEKPASIYKPID
jgi:dGTPase